MKSTRFFLLSALLLPFGAHAALPLQARFTDEQPGHTWALGELNPDLPSNWTGFEFLVLEFRASGSQRFELGLETSQGRVAKRIGPFAGVWVRAAIPLRFYRQPPGDGIDMAATYNQPRNSYWINIHSSATDPLTDVRGIAVTLNHPVVEPTLEIRSVTLAKDDPGDAVLEGKPLIDEFGQYTQVDWPGKAHSLEDLEAAWATEAKALSAQPSKRCPYGGFIDTRAEATGFFRVEQRDGRWWMVCPDGHWFYSSGVNGVGTRSGTRVQGRRDLFAELPPPDLTPGNRRGGSFGGSFYTWNLQRRFGEDWPSAWAEFTTQRLTAWGFNTVHNWGAPSRTRPEPRVPYALMMRGWQTGRSIMGMPDVYAEDFATRVDEAAAGQLAEFRDDPYMLGIFIGNEPPWPGRESQLCDAILAGEAGEMQRRLKAYLNESDTPERRETFVLATFQRYIDTINAAVRRHDTHHLNLGIRFGGNPHDDVIRVARDFDVFSLNIYRSAPDRAVLDRVYAIVQRPMLIGEFHIGAPERGLAPGLVQAMNQEERGVAYRYYVEQAASHPAMVGTHWFQWLDQPATGRGDGENYNIGFVDVVDRPYAELVQAAVATHDRLFEVHSGRTPPFATKPRTSTAATDSSRDTSRVTITPEPSTGVLLNPGKGWSVMGLPDRHPPEVLALAGMGVLRLDWSRVEPREGSYDWTVLDRFLESWARLGKVCNVGVMCANTHSRAPGGYVTPRWVFEAGARQIEIDLNPDQSTTGTPGRKIAPVFDDPVFLAKFANFLRAFARRYDGDPRIAVLDIRSYGNWGEAHMHPFGGPDIAPEKFREHVQMHLDAFQQTQLCLSRNAHLGRFGPLKPIFDWAVLEKRIAPRRDGICGNSDGSETAIGFGIAPGVFELFDNYDGVKQRGWWEGRKDRNGMGFTLEECIERGKPTWVDLGRGGQSGLRMLQENRSLIERLSNRIGYHFHLQRAVYPRRIGPGELNLELSWINQGVAPVSTPCALAVALIDDDNRRVATAWPEACRPAGWLPGEAVVEPVALRLPPPAPGSYRLALALTRKIGDPTPFIRLGTALPTVDGWVVLGRITVEGG